MIRRAELPSTPRQMLSLYQPKAKKFKVKSWEVFFKTPCILQLRYLQTLNNIAAENNSTVVFPVPMDLFSKVIGSFSDSSGADCQNFTMFDDYFR